MPVFTMWKPCKSSGFFSDSQYIEICSINDNAVHQILIAASLSKPIIPLRKIGQGHSRMQEFAPKAFLYLKELLEKIKYSDIVWQ